MYGQRAADDDPAVWLERDGVARLPRARSADADDTGASERRVGLAVGAQAQDDDLAVRPGARRPDQDDAAVVADREIAEVRAVANADGVGRRPAVRERPVALAVGQQPSRREDRLRHAGVDRAGDDDPPVRLHRDVCLGRELRTEPGDRRDPVAATEARIQRAAFGETQDRVDAVDPRGDQDSPAGLGDHIGCSVVDAAVEHEDAIAVPGRVGRAVRGEAGHVAVVRHPEHVGPGAPGEQRPSHRVDRHPGGDVRGADVEPHDPVARRVRGVVAEGRVKVPAGSRRRARLSDRPAADSDPCPRR